MTKKLLSICLSLILFVSLLPSVSLAREEANLIYLKANKSSLNVGDLLTVSVEGENLTNLYGNDVRITFDPTILEYVDQSITVTHNLTGGFPVKKVESIPLILAHTQVGDSLGVSGNHRLYTLTFRAKKAGAASINFTSIERIVVSGSTNVIYSDPVENRGVTVQINHAPTNISLSGASVAENATAGTTVGTLGAEDPDVGDTFTYTLVSGEGSADNASFEIIGNELKSKAVFDYETKNTYSIRVQVKDSNNATFEKAFAITITNLNELPFNITLSGANVAENTAAGTMVGTLGAEDPNVGEIFTYTLVSGEGGADNASFEIIGNELKTKAVFDYETKNTYSIRVQVKDSNNAAFEKAFAITVTNVNELPSNITLSGANVAENAAAGTTVGTFSAEDPDNGETFTYTLVSGEGGTDNASFEIEGSALKTKAVFDNETKNTYNIRVQVKDSNNAAYEKAFAITITNVNELPFNITLSGTNVAENAAAGTTVGTLSAEDPDNGETFTYTLVSGEGGTDNASFEIDGNELKTKSVFDYETKNTYGVRVQVKDSHNTAFEKIFDIAVTNVNELPANITLSGTSVAENASAGTSVGTLGAVDPDTGETFTYTLIDGEGGADNASFEIDGSTLKTKSVFDYETKNTYSIRAQVKDSADHVYAKAFTIHVTDVNENVNPGPGSTPTPTPTPSPTPTSKPTPGPTPSVSPVAVVASPDANGVATANITEEELSKSIQNPGVKLVKIEVTTSETADEVVVNLPAQQVQTADSSGITRIEVDTGLATVSFDPKVLEETLGADASNVQLSVAIVDQSNLPDDVKEKVGDNPIYDFNLSVDGNKISEFKGNEVRVGIPYTLKPGENPNKMVIYYINDEGVLEVVKNGKFNPETGKVEFKAKHFSKYAASYADVTFQDIAHLDWAVDAIEGLAARRVVQGTGEGQFCPDGQVTRAQFITMLMETFDLINPSAVTSLKDVSAGAWYYSAVASAQQLDIVQGKTEDTFGIDDPISRQDMAVLMFRALKVMNVQLQTAANPAAFEDQSSISDYALDAVRAMHQAGIIQGVGDGLFAPCDQATRAQAAVILYRLLSRDE